VSALLRIIELKKNFGSVEVVRGVSFEVARGQVVSVVGDNGAGKSTLMKCITGVYHADAGEIWFDGQRRRIAHPGESRALGIEMIYQDLALGEAAGIIERLGARVGSVRRRTDRLSGGQRQSVAIARALTFQPKLVIMDEPTAALAVREVEHVLDLIRELRRQEIAVILISHRLTDVFEVSDRIITLRQGEVIADEPVAETSMRKVVAHIVGAA
jgi:ABC-type sugar transport system ATPase subunit